MHVKDCMITNIPRCTVCMDALAPAMSPVHSLSKPRVLLDLEEFLQFLHHNKYQYLHEELHEIIINVPQCMGIPSVKYSSISFMRGQRKGSSAFGCLLGSR